MKRWGQRFLASTRGQVVALLRRGAASVNDLADALDLSDNAIRSHLTTLERDGLIKVAGKRPGVRKPETLYGITAEGEQLFPKAYHLILNGVLTALSGRLSVDEIKTILREVGRSLGASPAAPPHGVEVRERAEEAVEVLSSLGGLADLEETEDGLVIRGYSCPVSEAVSEHPEVCSLAESLLSEIIGAPVRETCDRNGKPRCTFEITAQT